MTIENAIEYVGEIFDKEIAGAITAPTPVKQAIRVHVYRRAVLSKATDILLGRTMPLNVENTYELVIDSIQQAGLSSLL